VSAAPAGILEELRSSGRLPSPGGVALKLMELTRRDDVSSAELSRTLQMDPALAGRVLRAANSAASGRAAVSIGDAVVRVGFDGVRRLAMGFSLVERNGSGACQEFDYKGYWSRSLAAAVAAERFARETRAAAGDEAFTLGLLHEVGALALATVHPREYGYVIGIAGQTEAQQRVAERETFRVCHRELTGLMLADWQIPAPLVAAVVGRGEFDAAAAPRAQRLADLVELAVVTGRLCAAQQALAPQVFASLGPLLERLQMSRADYERILPEVIESWREWGKELEVETRDTSTVELLALYDGESPSAARARAAAAAAGAAVAPLRVVLAEDTESQRITLTRLLTALGFEVRAVADGQEALEAIRLQPADIVVTDLVMPRLDGIGLCRALRESSSNDGCYVIVFTGFGDENKLVQAFEAGADDYLTKPVVRRELEARLRAARRVVGLQRQLAQEADALRELNAQLEVANRQLASAALTDSLTGLPNRRHVLERLRQEWSLAARHSRPFGVVFVDLDHFKKINDVRGHHAGDIVLERVSRVLRRVIRTEDTAGRFGGEEFVVLCPGANHAQTMRAAERIRVELEAEEFSIGGDTWHVTASLGVAAVGAVRGEAQWDNALRQADAALYRAKHQGRNRVVAAAASD
jgi:two-component system, cell cycle response regulator